MANCASVGTMSVFSSIEDLANIANKFVLIDSLEITRLI